MFVSIYSVGDVACGAHAGLAKLWHHTQQLSLAGRGQLFDLCIYFGPCDVGVTIFFVTVTNVVIREAIPEW